MITPTPDQGGADRPDALDRMHEQGKQRAARIPEFDVEQTLIRIRGDRMPDHLASDHAGLSRTLALSFRRRTFTVKLEVGRAGAVGASHLRRPPASEAAVEPQPATTSRAAGRWPRFARLVRQIWKKRKRHSSGEVLPPKRSAPPGERGNPATSSGRIGTPISFWDALDPADRSAFLAQAHERTFARGASLMTEGEAADYVAVILSGWTKICVGTGGAERVIARRGPGDLVGERAALQVSVRSASVVAMEAVQALVMDTEDFTAFVSAHPAVLDVLEEQIYARLTEHADQDQAGEVSHPDRTSPGYGLARSIRDKGGLVKRRPPLNGENCTVVLTDVVGFGALPRTDDDRSIIRGAIHQTMQMALTGLWDECSWEDRGDGLLIVVRPEIPTANVLERLRGELPDALKRHNRDYAASAQIQLRVAIDVGPVVSDVLGVTGDVIARAARLLTAPALKRAISEKGASLGVIVSDFIHETAARQTDGQIATADYEEIQVNVKQASLPTRIQLIA